MRSFMRVRHHSVRIRVGLSLPNNMTWF